MPSELPEDGWLMVTNKLTERIQELEHVVNELYRLVNELRVDTVHDREGEQDGC